MFEKLKALAARLDELEMRLSAPDLYDDPDRAARLLRERNELEPIVAAYREYEKAQQMQADATEMLSDPEMKELAQEELQQAKNDIARLEDELKILLLPRDPNDEKNIYVEIRGGAGGTESASRIYDRVPKRFYIRVLFTTFTKVVCRVERGDMNALNREFERQCIEDGDTNWD